MPNEHDDTILYEVQDMMLELGFRCDVRDSLAYSVRSKGNNYLDFISCWCAINNDFCTIYPRRSESDPYGRSGKLKEFPLSDPKCFEYACAEIVHTILTYRFTASGLPNYLFP